MTEPVIAFIFKFKKDHFLVTTFVTGVWYPVLEVREIEKDQVLEKREGIFMLAKPNIESKMNEAEVCRSMHLLNDSLRIYEEVLADVPPVEAALHARVQNRIRLVKQEISDFEGRKPDDVTDDEIDSIIDQLPDQEDAEMIFDKASAFQEMGLHQKAVTEYIKLFNRGFPFERFITELSESLLKIHSPQNAAAEIDQLIKNQNLEKHDRARIKFLIGRELEKRDHRETALGLYKAAGRLDPFDVEIKKSMELLSEAFATGSRYDYLLGEGIVTDDQLQKAFALSKEMKHSVEYVLIEHCRVKKEAIGKSFSLFYGCPFREYDPAFPVPVELLAELKKAFQLNACWIPMSWDKNRLEILVDDPRDLNKTDNIKSLLKTNKINFSVAIREDIQKYIQYFLRQRTARPNPLPRTQQRKLTFWMSNLSLIMKSPTVRKSTRLPAKWSVWWTRSSSRPIAKMLRTSTSSPLRLQKPRSFAFV
jgi:tetratricopeptide (TPR) repeat protein